MLQHLLPNCFGVLTLELLQSGDAGIERLDIEFFAQHGVPGEMEPNGHSTVQTHQSQIPPAVAVGKDFAKLRTAVERLMYVADEV